MKEVLGRKDFRAKISLKITDAALFQKFLKMLISYLVVKCLRYNSLTTREADNHATRKSLHTSSIGYKFLFPDKLIQKKGKPLSH